MTAPVLGPRELNRATLGRQMLLAREKTTPLKAVERLAGLQAQLARPPHIGLWSRVDGYEVDALNRLARDRKVVRATLMRVTLHLVSAKDFLALRPVLQPMLSAGMVAILKDRTRAFDLDRVVATARACLEKRPCTFEDLREQLDAAFPKSDVRAMGYAVRTHLPLVQVPDETRWGYPGAAAFAVAEAWLGTKVPASADLDGLVLRYLAAFGPATVKDAETWSYLKGLAPTFEALRPRLVVFRDDRKRELFDLPKAPRPPSDTPAPVRFLPDYDNLLLSYADRRRVISDEHRPRVMPGGNLRLLPTFLVDGFVRGVWAIERKRAAATLVLEPFETIPKKVRSELADEGEKLLRFVEPDARTFDVRFK
jgi:hypothetical protein